MGRLTGWGTKNRTFLMIEKGTLPQPVREADMAGVRARAAFGKLLGGFVQKKLAI